MLLSIRVVQWSLKKEGWSSVQYLTDVTTQELYSHLQLSDIHSKLCDGCGIFPCTHVYYAVKQIYCSPLPAAAKFARFDSYNLK